jgi:hypothetical protein
VNARKRAVLPVVKERQALADGLLRYLTALGLKSHAKTEPTNLLDYLRARGDAASSAE